MTIAKHHIASFYDVSHQSPGAPLLINDVVDEDQRIEHSDDDRQGLIIWSRPTYFHQFIL